MKTINYIYIIKTGSKSKAFINEKEALAEYEKSPVNAFLYKCMFVDGVEVNRWAYCARECFYI